MSKIQTKVFEIKNAKGLHARASAKFVKTCERFKADVDVSKGEATVSGLSIMGLMMLGARFGTKITVDASGPEASEAMEAISQLIDQGFGEL